MDPLLLLVGFEQIISPSEGREITREEAFMRQEFLLGIKSTIFLAVQLDFGCESKRHALLLSRVDDCRRSQLCNLGQLPWNDMLDPSRSGNVCPVYCFSSLASMLSSAAAADPFWMQTIKHQGISAFNSNPTTYQVFRNVKDFGAKVST